jgi:hypothetical protein
MGTLVSLSAKLNNESITAGQKKRYFASRSGVSLSDEKYLSEQNVIIPIVMLRGDSTEVTSINEYRATKLRVKKQTKKNSELSIKLSIKILNKLLRSWQNEMKNGNPPTIKLEWIPKISSKGAGKANQTD